MKKITITLALLISGIFSLNAQCIFTIAGQGYSGSTVDSIQATASNILYCWGVVTDSLGDYYVTVAQDDIVKKVSPSGLMTTIAGTGSVGVEADGIPATNASISSPHGIAVDPKGNIYITDLGDERIRIVNKAGIINTLAGTGNTTYNGDGIAATAANINNPYGVAVDDSGNVYIAEYSNNRIRKVSVITGKISTIAGNGTAGSTGDGGLATAAEVNYPTDVKVDGNYNVYFCENAGQRIRKITHSTNKVSTIGGNGSPGNTGDGGLATAATINAPEGIAVDKSGNVYIADWNNSRVREIVASTAKMEPVGGNSTMNFYGDNGPATAAAMNQPTGVAVDKSGNIYVADFYNSRIREITSGASAIPTNTTPTINLTICAGESTTLSVSDASLGVIAWYNASSGGSHVGSTDTLVTGPLYSSMTYYVEDSSGCSISSRVAISVTVNPNPYVALTSKRETCGGCGYYTMCQGTSDTLIATATGGTAPYAKYTWLPSIGTTTSSLQEVNPTVTTGYTVQVTDSKGCMSAIPTFSLSVDTFQEKVLPAVVTAGTFTTVSCGAGAPLTSTYNPTLPTTITWAPSGSLSSSTIAAPTASPAVNTTYTVTAKLKNGCMASDTVSVHVKPATISMKDTAITCESTILLNAVYVPASPPTVAWSPSTYLSSASVANPNCFATKETHYTVTSTYANGCTASDTVTVGNAIPSGISICDVSVDTASAHNIIVWNKTGLAHIDSFKVYYMNSASVWQLVKAQPFSAPAYVVDSTPINNPNANTVRYCLTAVDSCGNEEHFSTSLWQNTTYMIGNGSGTFSWAGTGYLIEGVSNPVLTYILNRDTLSNGHWQAIDSVSGSQTVMTDVSYSKYPLARYRVDARFTAGYGGCGIPDLRPEHAANSTTSRSNTGHNGTFTGIKSVVNTDAVSVFPNPAGQTLNVKFGNVKAATIDIAVVDVMGRTLLTTSNEVTANSTIPLNISNLPSGVYFVKVTTSTSSQVVKFVKE